MEEIFHQAITATQNDPLWNDFGHLIRLQIHQQATWPPDRWYRDNFAGPPSLTEVTGPSSLLRNSNHQFRCQVHGGFPKPEVGSVGFDISQCVTHWCANVHGNPAQMIKILIDSKQSQFETLNSQHATCLSLWFWSTNAVFHSIHK